MGDWNVIDLHQHTNHDIDCNGKTVENTYTHRDYYEFLKIQNAKLKAVTCHNNINLSEHIKQAIISDLLGINHLVGVEIDYKFQEIEFHAISILSPNVDVIDFSNKLKEIRERNIQKTKKIFFNQEDFCQLHQNTEFIYIPHAIKDKGILEQKIGELETSTIDWVIKVLISGLGFPILFESTREYHIYSVINKINSEIHNENVKIEISGYVGGDYKFDNDLERKNKVLQKPRYCINSLPTYRGLEIALRNSETRLSLEKQVINRERFIRKIKIADSENFIGSEIEFSPGLNVIIGNSGSGKTLLLNQIYYEIKGESLSAAQKEKTSNKKSNQYVNKVGRKSILDIDFDKKISKEELKLLEIPNVYSEILRMQDDTGSITKIFGIDDVSNIDRIILDYKGILNNYFQCISQIDIYINNGKQNLTNIKSAIDFLENNKLENNNFVLKKEIYNENDLQKLNNKLEKINKHLEKKENYEKDFLEIKELISDEEKKKEIDVLLQKYIEAIKLLSDEKLIITTNIKDCEYEKRLNCLINDKIEEANNKLGSKERARNTREETYRSELNSLEFNLKNAIIEELKKEEFDLTYPYENIKREIEKNYNEYARLTLDDKRFNINEVDILESPLFNLNMIKTKVKDMRNDKIDMQNTEQIKEIVKRLKDEEINFSSILTDGNNIPKNIELYLKDKKEWRLIQNINRGDIAKKSIEYHFNKLILENQPDIIFIDQPENDVDKSFISSTLSKFIKEQKVDKQIIVTSHDAIVAINSDVNKIIEASIDEKNRIFYKSFDLEYVEKEEMVATNIVSEILDGGKSNIKKRYQVYGGELNYENYNL